MFNYNFRSQLSYSCVINIMFVTIIEEIKRLFVISFRHEGVNISVRLKTSRIDYL